jgi:hypothetical protein
MGLFEDVVHVRCTRTLTAAAELPGPFQICNRDRIRRVSVHIDHVWLNMAGLPSASWRKAFAAMTSRRGKAGNQSRSGRVYGPL